MREHLHSVGFQVLCVLADLHASRDVPPPSLRPRKSLFQEGTARNSVKRTVFDFNSTGT